VSNGDAAHVTTTRERARILIVDDRPANLLAIRATLEPLAQELVTASSGEEALDHLSEDRFAVILMDVRMPGLDGMKTAQLIRQRDAPRQTPIIFLSAFPTDSAGLAEGYARGAVDFLLKPIEPEILRSKVRIFVELFLTNRQLVRHAELLRRAERQALERKNELRLRSLTDAMAALLCTLSRYGAARYANRALIEFTGLAPGRRLNPYWRAVHPEDARRLMGSWSAARQRGMGFESQFRLKRLDGVYRWLLARAVPEREESGEITNWIVTAVDITAEREAREQAESANRLKDEFLATVSHELRNPLNAILGWTHLLRSSTFDESRSAHALDIIDRNARLQAALIDDMLDVSRIIMGRLRLQLRQLALTPIIDAAIRALLPAADTKGIELESHLEAATDAVTADSARLQQVVWNLLSNAVKFTPKGGRVKIALSSVGSWLELAVTDTGEGITRDFLPHVFEPFRQADSTTTKTHGGLGLGLSIVRHLVAAHGGTVAAESSGTGQGATFRVRLPALGNKPAEQRDPSSNSDLSSAALAGRTIVVVDDDADGCELVAEVLGRSGARVIASKSAEEALAAFHQNRPDAIVTDIGMPHYDGYELVRRIRELPEIAARQVPVIAVSALGGKDLQAKVLRGGFQAYMPKPIDPAGLVRAIQGLVSTREA